MERLRQSCRKLLDEAPRCGNHVAAELLGEIVGTAEMLADAPPPTLDSLTTFLRAQDLLYEASLKLPGAEAFGAGYEDEPPHDLVARVDRVLAVLGNVLGRYPMEERRAARPEIELAVEHEKVSASVAGLVVQAERTGVVADELGKSLKFNLSLISIDLSGIKLDLTALVRELAQKVIQLGWPARLHKSLARGAAWVRDYLMDCVGGLGGGLGRVAERFFEEIRALLGKLKTWLRGQGVPEMALGPSDPIPPSSPPALHPEIVALEEKVTACRAALQKTDRARDPLGWAGAQYKLGNALCNLSERGGGTARLEEAVAAYRAALEERTRDRVPLDWAMTQNNLGNALSSLGEREGGTARLEEAVAAYRAALEEWTREQVPLDWAMTQNNLGVALRNLGEREGGTARLEEAVAAYRAALEERTRELAWAMTQNNLGEALVGLAERERDIALAEEAVKAFRSALREATPERHQRLFEEASRSLERALALLERLRRGG
ncbi:MAG: tetratricopeptide repeat protein [Alphaproteobacteria bacterium]|nr:tetratricopeptide repeat protein [Alphaproteobacteria bacterium]